MIVVGDKVKTSPDANFMPAKEGRVIYVEGDLYRVAFEGSPRMVGTYKLHELEEPPYSTTESGYKIIFPVGSRVHVKPQFLALRLTSYPGTVTVVNDGGYTVLFDNGVTEDGLSVTWLEREEEPAPLPLGSVVRVTRSDNPYSETRALYGADQGIITGEYIDPAYGQMYRVEFSGNRVDGFAAKLIELVPPDEQYGAKSADDIEALKQNWRFDPCWDIEETEGFEAHRAELKAYRERVEAEATRSYRRKQSLTGELPYIKIGKAWLRVDAIQVVEENGGGDRLFILNGRDAEKITITGRAVKALRSWLDAQAYDLAGEEHE